MAYTKEDQETYVAAQKRAIEPLEAMARQLTKYAEDIERRISEDDWNARCTMAPGNRQAHVEAAAQARADIKTLQDALKLARSTRG